MIELLVIEYPEHALPVPGPSKTWSLTSLGNYIQSLYGGTQ